jgi:TRAP-type C4-dicarboxylate transport system substrate-binding protein
VRTRRRLIICVAALALAACGRDGASPAETRTTLDVAASTTTGTPAERHWQWFVTNVRSWAPEYRVALVNRTAENGPASLAGGRAGIVHVQPAELVALLPELALLTQPLLFVSDAEADHVLDRHVLPEVRRRLDAHGLTLLGWTEGEPRVAYFAHEPVGPEVEQALLAEHAALDGRSLKLTGAPVLLDAGHVPGLILAANAWFDPLSPHDEDVFRMAYATKDARADTRRVAGETVARLAGDPVLAVRLPTAEERERWREQLAPSRTDAAAAVGDAGQSLLATIERGRAEFAAAPPAR